MKFRALIAAAAFAVAVPIAVLSACADSISAGYDPAPPPGTSFVDPDAATAPEHEASMCNAYDCPAPYDTCSDKPGVCNTNLKTDLRNCGACGNACTPPDGKSTPNAELTCVDGKCHVACNDPLVGDCNGKVEDGCEATLDVDPANCGACGNACKAGEVCWRAVCGCPPGYAQCGETCTQLDRDPDNCSACGAACTGADAGVDASVGSCDAGVIPPHYGPICSKSACAVGCIDGYGNCNSDLCADGCETNLGNDTANCGACGHACLPGQGCVKGKCECEDTNFTFCGKCVDVMTNAGHCGACGNQCPGSPLDPQAGGPICVQGRCSFLCPAGRADCDQRIENGCEIDMMTDPRNCGGCGVQCDSDGGQPCIDGHCLMKPCDLPDGGPVQ